MVSQRESRSSQVDTADRGTPTHARVLYPVAWAAWPVLIYYAPNADEIGWTDLSLVLAVTTGSAALVYLVLRFALRDAHRAGILVAVYATAVLTYNTFLQSTARILPDFGRGDQYVLPAVWLLLLALLTIYFVRTKRDLQPWTGLANCVTAALLVFALLQIGHSLLLVARPEMPQDVTVGQLDQTQLIPAGPRPDFYYLVFDRYASNAVLDQYYGYSNARFSQALRDRGFFVHDQAHCNYGRSNLSLWSSLNMEYLPPTVDRRQVSSSLLRGHRVGAIVQAAGYRYYHLGSWYRPTSYCRLADESIASPMRISAFGKGLIELTPLNHVRQFRSLWFDQHAEIARSQLEHVRRLARAAGPKFVFAHILLPHPPFVFDQDGRRVAELSEHDGASKDFYLQQLAFTNRKIIGLVDQLQQTAPTPPIIILQGDEGPVLRGAELRASVHAQLQIRTGVLNAIHAPGIDAETWSRWTTPVNTFRILLSHYAGQQLASLEDRIYSFQGIIQPSRKDYDRCDFDDVTEQLLGAFEIGEIAVAETRD